MDTLLSEIEKQKKSIQNTAGPKKYVKRADLEKERELKYLEEQKLLQEKRNVKIEPLKTIRIPPKTKVEKEFTPDLKEPIDVPSNEEIIKYFRSIQLPITLFGETEDQKIKRFIQIKESRGKNLSQDNFMKTYLELEAGLNLEDMKKHPIEDEEDLQKRIKEAEGKGIKAMETDPINPALVMTEPDRTKALITVFFKRLLREWEEDLEKRPEDVKKSRAGKAEAENLRQTHDFLKPFFTLLRDTKSLEDDVAQSIAEMCHYMQHRDYVRANDAYLRLAIGNAPWPIGVSGVGIHERSARERIGPYRVAHVLNDEMTRKWIQSIKRLITFCQKSYPSSDITRMVKRVSNRTGSVE